MGFMLEKYTNNLGGLRVAFFDNNVPIENYFDGDSVEEAIQHFNMYLKNNQLYIHTEQEISLSEVGISSVAEAEQLREELNEITSSMTDEEAIERPVLFPNWKVGVNYTVNTRIRYGGRIFKVLQAHTSQEDWTPSRAPSLFAEILVGEKEPTEWQQPSSTNPYLTGDRVIFNNQVYESLIDNNVWAPNMYPQGWQLIETEEETSVEEPEQETIPEWSQPDSTNPYMTGDKVTYNGQVYQSSIDNNIWSPEAYPAGWTLIE